MLFPFLVLLFVAAVKILLYLLHVLWANRGPNWNYVRHCTDRTYFEEFIVCTAGSGISKMKNRHGVAGQVMPSVSVRDICNMEMKLLTV